MKREDEVEVTQYLRPDGRTRPVYSPVGKDYAEKAKGLILSAEVLPTGQVVLYARRQGDPEESELCELVIDGPDANEPTEILKRMIDQLNGGSK